MQLLVIRHGKAEDKEEFARTGKADGLRPLTPDGEREMAHVANGLIVTASKIDVLASSPLMRARQTAAIVARAYDLQHVQEVDALEPDSPPDALLAWLRGCDGEAVVAVVGHEPHLATVVTWLLTGRAEPCLHLKKAGACRVDFESVPEAGRGALTWLLTPTQLRRLGA